MLQILDWLASNYKVSGSVVAYYRKRQASRGDYDIHYERQDRYITTTRVLLNYAHLNGIILPFETKSSLFAWATASWIRWADKIAWCTIFETNSSLFTFHMTSRASSTCNDDFWKDLFSYYQWKSIDVRENFNTSPWVRYTSSIIIFM